jgi:hypothetical protein
LNKRKEEEVPSKETLKKRRGSSIKRNTEEFLFIYFAIDRKLKAC